MSNLSVKGITDEQGIKHFQITNKDTGEIHMAIRSGQKFEVGEFRGTLKQCKDLVAASKVVHFADAPPEPESNHSAWDCCHPCSLLILLAAGGDVCKSEIDRTLNAFGWLKPDGEHDALGARENYEKWSKQ